MRHTATPQANPVRLSRPGVGLWRIALPRFRRGDSPARQAAAPKPADPAELATAIVAAPVYDFPAMPEAVVQADALLNLYRFALDAHDDVSGYTPADVAAREATLRARLPEAWSDLQRAARRFLSVVEAHEAAR